MYHMTDPVTTAEQLAAMPDDGQRYELQEGILHMMSPAGFRHGQVAARLLSRISTYVENHDLGVALAAETGFLLRHDPDTVLAPDVSFVARDRLREFGDHAGYLPLAPDLVAEVISPNDRAREVDAKIRAWLSFGVKVVLQVDPMTSTVHVFRSGSEYGTGASGFVDLGDVLPGFQLDVAELFA
ncbi:MAG: Uma2 family endonuclease [Pirellulaceae bacterium]|nr:Uma2 family endonuclease [Pirellulaceae bacterium]